MVYGNISQKKAGNYSRGAKHAGSIAVRYQAQGLELKHNRCRKKEKFGERGYRSRKKRGRDKDQQMDKNVYIKHMEVISSKNQNNNVVSSCTKRKINENMRKWKFYTDLYMMMEIYELV